MRLTPPKVIIDPAVPFKDALFGRKDFALSLTALMRGVIDNLVIFVNSPWGEGKTTFAQMWQAYLSMEKHEVIYFDAYAADYFEDPFVAFTGEILDLTKKKLGKTGSVAERNFKKEAVEVAKRLGGLAVKVGLRAATMGAVEATHIKELAEIGKEVATGVSDIGADFIEKKIENHAGEKAALAEFKESLAQIAKLVREQQGFPLTIIVDELDRCRPDFALGLLERMKHLFDVENVAFVLLVNRHQIETYIRSVYGQGMDASAYLLKFGNLFVDLPSREIAVGPDKGRREYCVELMRHHELSKVPDGDLFLRSLDALIDHFHLTLREIERMFTIFTIYYASYQRGHIDNGFWVSLLVLLKLKDAALYNDLAHEQVSFTSFLERTHFDAFHPPTHTVDKGWVRDILAFCLMSDAEYAEATKQDDTGGPPQTRIGRLGSWLSPYDLDRRQVIPVFCRRLNRFSLQP